MTIPPDKPVLMAVIGAPHGVRGELRVKAHTGDPLALGDYGPLSSEDGRRFEILALRPQKEMLVVRFKGVADRDAAQALTGTKLFIARSALPDDLDDEEFYHADLVGLSAVTLDGETIGSIEAVQNFGGGDLLEIARAGGRTVLIPFTLAAVPEVNLAERIVRIDPVAAGLTQEAEDDH